MPWQIVRGEIGWIRATALLSISIGDENWFLIILPVLQASRLKCTRCALKKVSHVDQHSRPSTFASRHEEEYIVFSLQTSSGS